MHRIQTWRTWIALVAASFVGCANQPAYDDSAAPEPPADTSTIDAEKQSTIEPGPPQTTEPAAPADLSGESAPDPAGPNDPSKPGSQDALDVSSDDPQVKLGEPPLPELPE